MKLKTFTAPDMQQAMQMVRASMGDDAVILSTAREQGGKGVTVIAAAEKVREIENPPQEAVEAESIGAAILPFSPRIQEQARREIGHALRFHSVPEYVSQKILQACERISFEAIGSVDDLQKALARVFEATFGFAPLPVLNGTFRIMLVGPPGIGKTMTIAKLAAQLVMNKKNVAVITTDTKRAGGIEQLSSLTNILGIELKVAATRAELRDALQECPEDARVLIDSAGSNPYDYRELKELGEFVGIGGIEPILVAAAGGDCGEAEEIARAFSFLGITKLLVTRTDVARRFGSVLTTAHIGDLTFCNASATSRVVGELEPLSAESLSELIVKHKREL